MIASRGILMSVEATILSQLDVDQFDSDPNGQRPHDPAEIAADVLLAHALTGSGALAGIVIVEPWNASWTELLAAAWADLAVAAQQQSRDLLVRFGGTSLSGTWLVLNGESGASRSRGNDTEKAAKALCEGRSVCAVSSSPEQSLPGDLTRSVDHRIPVGPISADLLGTIVEAVTGDKSTIEVDAVICGSLTPSAFRLARRSGQSADDYCRRLADYAERADAGRQGPIVVLDDIHGMQEAVAWGRELARDLAEYRTGTLGWSDVDRGCLLVGEPGTGKTTFARALAVTCGVPLVDRWHIFGRIERPR